jgi:hypothetical protein
MHSRGLKCFRQSWDTFVQGCNAFYRVGTLSTELEYLCTGLQCFLQGWNAIVSVGTLSTVLEYLCTVLPCFRQSWNTFVQGGNAF